VTSTSEATAVADYTLALADDALIASHRLTEWVARAPEIEEDVALANIALDLLGQARLLLQYAGSLHRPARTEDDLAHLRDEGGFRNVCLVERENGDFAVTIARLLLFSAYQRELYGRLVHSTDATLAAVAAKAVKEVDYHCDHARLWALRLGDGTPESHTRMQAGLDAEWPWAAELFDGAWLPPGLVGDGVAVDPALLEPAWRDRVLGVVAEATLAEPTGTEPTPAEPTPAEPTPAEPTPADPTGHAVGAGRHGRHTEVFGALLAEMQELARSHPGASW